MSAAITARREHWHLPEPQQFAGVFFSFLAHAALVFGLIWWNASQPVRDMQRVEDIVPVDVTTIADTPQIKEVAKPSMQAAPRETVLDKTEAPKPAAAKTKQADDGIEDPKAGSTSTGNASQLNTRKLASLIDKSIKEADRKPKKFDKLAQQLEKDLPQQAVLSQFEMATLQQALFKQINDNYSKPSGIEGVDTMRVTIRLVLSPLGRVVGQPQVIEKVGLTADNAAAFRAFSEATLRAIFKTQPYKLPADKYDAWKESEIRFKSDELGQ